MRGSSLTDLIFPLCLMLVVSMMIFPLPQWILDICLMGNLAFSLALLIGCAYLLKPEEFTCLPSILLISTLFRLGLNVSTTRSILTEGSAPDTIVVFGQFVVGGSLLVGIVVFLIITAIQFIVIAKGAERIAEVAARFSLDALPGRQMAIDADIRQGMMSLAEAKVQRQLLQVESKLYGAMDGAMKFIKGDVIAGLVIIVINLIAGIAIGCIEHGLSFSKALEQYSLYTIGDGLCSQLPALIVSVSAGICMTRVASLEENYLGKELFQQITKEPKAILFCSVFVGIYSFLPGVPTLITSSISAGLFIAARVMMKNKKLKEQQSNIKAFEPRVLSNASIIINPGLLSSENMIDYNHISDNIRKKVFDTYGLVFPYPEVVFDENIEDEVILKIHSKTICSVKTSCTEQEITESFSLSAVNNATEIIDDTQTRSLIELHSNVCQDISNSIIPSKVSVTNLTFVIRELVSEGVSVKEFSKVLQACAEYASSSSAQDKGSSSFEPSQLNYESQLMLRYVRKALSLSISNLISAQDGTINAVALSASLDAFIARLSINNMPVEPRVAGLISQRVGESIGQARRRFENVILVTGGYSRYCLKQMLSNFDGLHVVSIDEISPAFKLNIINDVQIKELEPNEQEYNTADTNSIDNHPIM